MTACGVYTLPALANGNYFRQPGSIDPLTAGTDITATTTLYVAAGAPADVNCYNENSFTITITDAPLADAPLDVTACGLYTLPALTNGNYFRQPGSIDPLTAGTDITATTTLYVAAGDPADVNCYNENSFTITITDAPLADAPLDVTACGLYTLPALTNGNYFRQPGSIDPLTAGTDITATTTLYVAAGAPADVNCYNENSFTITITDAPLADAPLDVTACGLYTLPALTNGNYFRQPGSIDPLTAGTDITATTTLYVAAGAPADVNCYNENSFTITITDAPLADAPLDVTACGLYTLPALTNGNYFRQPGSIDPLTAGTDITATTTLYVAAGAPADVNCYNENSFTITITDAPLADAPLDVTACGLYTLPALTNGNYFRQPGSIDPLTAGTDITATTTLYVAAGAPADVNCYNENSFTITITDAPLADAPLDVTACGLYTLPALTNGNYFRQPGSIDPLTAGTDITVTTTLYVAAGAPADVNCYNENSFTITITDAPLADAPLDVTACGLYTLPALTNGNYFRQPGSIDPLTAGTDITATTTLYVAAGDPADVNCYNENSFTITITDAPLADAPLDVTACGLYTLPALTNGNYFRQPGSIDPLTAGTDITATTTLYVAAGDPADVNCYNENSFTITITDAPLADAPLDVTACGLYTLPALTNGNYFRQPGSIDPLTAGTDITVTTTLYVAAGAPADVNCYNENSFTITITDAPLADAPLDVTACGLYTLPALTNGNYFRQPGSIDPVTAGTDITATTTLYVAAGAPADVNCYNENSFTITITDAPLADAPLDVTACGLYTLPALTNGNYFRQPGSIDPLTAGTDITATTTLYVAAGAPADVNCYNENSFTITITDAPLADAPLDVTACGLYTLPALTNGNYFRQPGSIDPLTAGTDITATTTLYVAAGDPADVNCYNENSFTITITDAPLADAPLDVTACGLYTLPALTNGNYFRQPGSIDPLTAGTDITATTTLYVAAGDPADVNCYDENSFTVTITDAPLADAPLDVTACGLYTLPALTNGNYFRQPGSIDPVTAGTDITVTTTLYVAAGDPADVNCYDENSFTVTITDAPLADAPLDVTACGLYTLPALTNGNYFRQPGSIDPVTAGTDITVTTTLYVAAGDPADVNCYDENSFTVTITDAPLADAPLDVTACGLYTLPALTNGNYFRQPGSIDPVTAGTDITATTTLYVAAGAPADVNCYDENSFTVTITDAPLADAPLDVTACGLYTLPALTNGNYFRQPGSIDPVTAGTDITVTTTLYVAAGDPADVNCYDENSFTVTITDAPLADAPLDVTACGLYTLPALTNGNYFRQPGSIDPVTAGTDITVTTTLYVAAGDPADVNCYDENSFTITITDAPLADAPLDVTACGLYTLPALTNGNYFRQPGSIDPVTAGTDITVTTTLYVAAGAPADVNCYNENSFTINITDEIVPVFAQLGPYCLNATPDDLPLTSTNGITGTWSPATIATDVVGTFIYTFHPGCRAGLCCTGNHGPLTSPMRLFRYSLSSGHTV